MCGSVEARQACGDCCEGEAVACCGASERSEPMPLAPASGQGGEFRAITWPAAILPAVAVRNEVPRPAWAEVRLRLPSQAAPVRTCVWVI